MSQQPKVAIILVNWNGLEDTLACLSSLRQLAYDNYEVIVVDNGSADDSVLTIEKSFPEVELIATGENLGFVGGNNVGLEYAQTSGAEFALLLNNDTEVAPDFLTHLVAAAAADPQVGITGPNIYYYDHPEILWTAGGGINWEQGTTWMIGLNETDTGQFGQEPRSVDFVTGCALFIKMAVVQEVGMLDPRFFAYYEETEWCVRVSQAGYKILHVPQAKIWHKISIERRAASLTVHYYMVRNQLLFLKATKAGWKAWTYTLLNDIRTLISWSIKPQWRHKRPLRNIMLRALKDYYTGRLGRATF